MSTPIQTKTHPAGWSAEMYAPNVHVIRMDHTGAGWEQKVLLSADRHHDNPKTDWDLERRHLKRADELGAPIIDGGDLFCAMQGKWDRRKDKSDIRPEHNTSNYLDALVDEASAFYEPYADNFVVVGRGNHDEAIRKNHETDILRRLCVRLGIFVGSWRGYVKFLFQRPGGGDHYSFTLYRTHGAGGGGPVTKGVIKTNRRAVYVPDADIVLSGHIHESWVVEIPRFRISQQHKFYQDTQWHVQTPTYKNEFKTGMGWVDSREMPPKPLGAWWITFRYVDGDIQVIPERAL